MTTYDCTFTYGTDSIYRFEIPALENAPIKKRVSAYDYTFPFEIDEYYYEIYFRDASEGLFHGFSVQKQGGEDS